MRLNVELKVVDGWCIVEGCGVVVRDVLGIFDVKLEEWERCLW